MSGKLVGNGRHGLAGPHEHVAARDIDLILQRHVNGVAGPGFR
jgi:hypothetical protein